MSARIVILGTMLVSATLTIVPAAINFSPAFIWNASANVPIGLYRILRIDYPVVIDLVTVMPTEPIARFLADRNYFPCGVPLLKQMFGLPGQTVCRIRFAVMIDGIVIATAREPPTARLAGLHSYPIRENRHLLIGRAKAPERYGLASEAEPGRWVVSDRAETTLKELGERNDIIKTRHRALVGNGLAEDRGVSQYVPHGGKAAEPVIGQVLAKGLAGDEMGERVYLVVDGVDGRVHHMIA